MTDPGARSGDGNGPGPSPRGTEPAQAASCRFCGRPLTHIVVDLGMSPLCESYLPADALDSMEPFYPLRAYVCDGCWLVQLSEYVNPEGIFSEYAYFSSYSSSWVAHARRYAEQMRGQLSLGPGSLVAEVGSNDGYLLQHFAKTGVELLGIDPAENVAVAARERGVPTVVGFFGVALARQLVGEGRRADLVIGNNVLAQVPDLNDFVEGLGILLAPDGLLTLEFPHLVRLLDDNQFDTIYHEHFSYFSLNTVARVLAAHRLRVVDVEELPTHGGSLRIHARHAESEVTATTAVAGLLRREVEAGLERLDRYRAFSGQVEATKRDLLDFLITARREGKTVVGYGAPGKANTLLNYCGIRTDFVSYTVDLNPYKRGRFTPGTHIPILHPDQLRETQPDIVWIQPWNLRQEIAQQLSYIDEWGGRLMVAIPRVEVW